MQGEKTSQSVRNALEQIRRNLDLWDCVVIIRGGGATTDLNGFDEYEVAKAVAVFPLPVAAGIGHERDRTVLDEIACRRCKTFTAVAAMLIDSLRLAYTCDSGEGKEDCPLQRGCHEGREISYRQYRDRTPARVQTRIMRSENDSARSDIQSNVLCQDVIPRKARE